MLALQDVTEADTRLIANTVIRGASGRYYSVRAMSFDEHDFQKQFVWETAEENSALDPVYLEYRFAKANDIAPGEILSVRVGNEYKDCYVAGLVSAVETMSVVPINGLRTYCMDYGYLYTSSHLFESEFNHEYEKGLAEWHEKRLELTDAEWDAQTQYENAQAELEKAKKELNEKKAEFAEKRPELEAQRAELRKQKRICSGSGRK